jgi:UDP-N-acetylglucosamine diphosphorylase / glucose-1-phosphate thymidylyltransferase / UDP-N-acetylgalactosamine diphosphorylase / glucosamine-1-phosphate N-acetyltransferase / galactosamine-1-phosphate N-acetyltransferase
MFNIEDFFDLSHCEHRALFENISNPWDVLPKIAAYLQFRLKPGIQGRLIGKPFISGAVFIGKNTVIEQGAMVKGPAWIGENCEIRSGCYIRENVIIGDGVVAGNSCEFKNSLVFDNAQIPHFNYVGDSILGYESHLGAGVILSNVRLDKAMIKAHGPEGAVPTGLRKFGAIVGDMVEIGCNSVISPGSLLGRQSALYPGSHWHGYLPPGHIAKVRQEFSLVKKAAPATVQAPTSL